MKDLIVAVLIALLLSLSGCSSPAGQPSFWTQCVKANGYGFTMATEFGPFNLGYLAWERNVNCGKDMKPITP